MSPSASPRSFWDSTPTRSTSGRVSPAAGGASPERAAAAAVREQCLALLAAAGPACVAVKFQLARFEVLGAPGRELLGELVAVAREQGLLVIADGKRGDIDVTAAAYAASLYGGLQTPAGALQGLGADLATVNPLMGLDAVEPFLAAARGAGAGVLLLVRTSNPGARDVEDLELADGGPVWERLAEIVNSSAPPGVGEQRAQRRGRRDRRQRARPSAPRARADARGALPAARGRRPGRGGVAARGRLRARRAGGLVSASRSIAERPPRARG